MDFDVLIIGSGAGGGMAALSLCQQGFKVGLVERGPRFDPKKDYVQNYPDWGQRNNPLEDAHEHEDTIDRRYLTEYNTVNGVYRRSANSYHRVHGLGGSTLHYQGEAHRFAPHAFNTHSDSGWGVDWPINYATLSPYYSKAEELLGVAGTPGNKFKAPRGDFPTNGHPLSTKSRILVESAQKAGFTLYPNTLALPSTSYDGRTPCQHSGGCNYGCVFGAKSSVDQAIIPIAEHTGNLSLLLNSKALRLNYDNLGKINSVQISSENKSRPVSARVYILAMGAVESPRLMLNSTSPQHENGFANQQDQVGRYYMETLISRISIRLSADVRTFTGPPIDARVWDFAKPQTHNTSGFVLGCAGYLNTQTDPVSHAVNTPGIGRTHKQGVRESFGKSLQLFGIAEQEPQTQNRVSLSNKKDKTGINKVKLHCEYSPRDFTTLDAIQSKLSLWANATPNKGIGRHHDSKRRAVATHVGGTCRMGHNSEESVVDAFGKVHGQDNCYITDASVLPSQGAGDSPSLTIQALALRTAEKIGADLKR